MGRGRRPLPHLRQLHDASARPASAPTSTTSPTSRGVRRAPAARGTRASRCDFTHVHGGSVRATARRPLPPVDDAQALQLVRPVRHARAASAAGAASPGARSRSTSPRRQPRSARPTGSRDEGDRRAARGDPVVRRAGARASRVVAGCARTRSSRRRACCCCEGEAADVFFAIREGDVALEIDRSRPRAPLVFQTLHDERPARLVVAVRLPSASRFDARAPEEVHSISSTAPACAANARRTTRSASS